MEQAREVVAAVESLFGAIVRQDVSAVQSRYLQDDRLFIFLEGWQGKLEGFDRETNAAAWQALFDQIAFDRIELTADARAGRDGALGWVGGTVSSSYAPVGGGDRVEVEQRGTWILELHEGEWVIVFEHVSFPKDRPYGAELPA